MSVPGERLVLLADDDEWSRLAACALLEFLGWQVIEALDGVHAVEVLRDAQAAGRRVDAAVLDVRMPRMNGAEALHALRVLQPGLPAVICTGFDESRLDPGLLATAGVRFLPKPFTVDQMARALAGAAGALP